MRKEQKTMLQHPLKNAAIYNNNSRLLILFFDILSCEQLWVVCMNMSNTAYGNTLKTILYQKQELYQTNAWHLWSFVEKIILKIYEVADKI